MTARNRLSVLANEIKAAHEAATNAALAAVDHARTAGIKLIEAKSLLAHGEWLHWLRKTGIAPRTAQGYMQLAKVPADKCATVAHLGIRKVLAEIAGREADNCSWPFGILTGNVEWFTPSCWVERARRAMGSIDLDPASNKSAQDIVRATRWFDKECDGLAHPWHSNVWLNPPYARGLIEQFVEKLILERHNFAQAIVLVDNRTDAKWFHRLGRIADAVAFTKGRIGFYKESGGLSSSPLNGNVFVYIGARVGDFVSAFGDACLIASVLPHPEMPPEPPR